MKIADAAQTFLSQKRIAVTGVSRAGTQHGANVVFQRLQERGYEVFAVNPNTPEVDGVATYPDLASIPGGVDAVVLATSAANTIATMREIVDLGIGYAWMHRSFGPGSVNPQAVRMGREAGVLVIDGGCPLMFGQASDGGHRFMCKMLKLTKAVPRQVA